jgi:hypothetical protein
MKKLPVIIFICLNVLICNSQEYTNNLNENVKDIVFVQMLNNLEVDYPIVIATPFFFAITSFQKSNSEDLFNENIPAIDKTNQNLSLDKQKFFTSLNIEFIPMFKSDKTIQIQAKMKNKLLYTSKLTKTAKEELFNIALPDESFSKEIIYQNGQLKSLTLVKPDERYWMINEKKSDSLFCQTSYNTKSGNYSFTDEFYQNNNLIRKVLYKNTTDRKSREIKRTWNYNYDTDGKILSIVSLDNRGIRTDSINYFYTGSKLTSIATYNNDNQCTIFYHLETGLISDYVYKGFENTVNIHYEYNNRGQIVSVLLKNTKKPFEESYIFEYNSTSNLVSIKKYTTTDISDELTYRNQYLFTYNSDKVLTSMIVTDKKGNIKKEIKYEINYLN